MNSNSNQQSNTARIDASLTETHTLISALKAQLKSGRIPTRLDIQAVETPMPKMLAGDREESDFL